MLSASAAAVAATAAYALDDPAAATLQSSPTTLLRRRAHRITLTLPALAVFWALATTTVSRSSPHLPVAAHTLQLATLVAIALAGASTIASVGDRTRGGTFGALAVLICFGTALLPASSLQLVPPNPAGPGAVRQLTVILAIAVALQLGSSTDPARRLALGRRRRGPRPATPAT
jgi:hypothetical protein